MLSEVLRKAYEEDRDICIFTKKRQTPAEKVAALALYKALESLNRDTKVKVISSSEDMPYPERVETETDNAIRLKNAIQILIGVRTKDDLAFNFEDVLTDKEVIFALDACGKDLKRGKSTIEKDFGILPRHISKEQNHISVCQTVAMLLKREELLSPEISTLLLFGILKDTNNLKEANASAIEMVSMLMENGGDYQRAYDEANRKLTVGERIVVSEIFKDIDFETLDNGKRVLYLTVDKETRKKLEEAGITDFKPYVQKLQEIADVDVAFAVFEKKPEKGRRQAFDVYFMKTSSQEQIDLDELSSRFGVTRGTKNFAECEYTIPRNKGMNHLVSQILGEIKEQYDRNGQRVQLPEATEQDRLLSEIIERTIGLSQKVSSDDLRKVAGLVRDGADYSCIYGDKIPMRIFLLREEILRSSDLHFDEDNNPKINLSKTAVDKIKARYGVSDQEILSCISVFSDTNAERADIRITSEEGTKVASNLSEQVARTKRMIKSAVVAGQDLRIRGANIKRVKDNIWNMIKGEKSQEYEIA